VGALEKEAYSLKRQFLAKRKPTFPKPNPEAMAVYIEINDRVKSTYLLKHGSVKKFRFDNARGAHEFRKRIILKIKLKCLKWGVLSQVPRPEDFQWARKSDFMEEIKEGYRFSIDVL
jgi:hypothetical protein